MKPQYCKVIPFSGLYSFRHTADGYRVGLADRTMIDFDKDGQFVKAMK